MIIKSKCIFDSVSDLPFEGYVVLEGSKIKKIHKMEGEEYEIENCSNIIDCGNRTVMPGICDGHVHVFLGALAMMSPNLYNTSSEEEAAKYLYESRKDNGKDWVIGFGWSHYNWTNKKLPSKELLDKYFPDRPVIAVNDELHALWVNTKALEVCGITNEIENPSDGCFKRDKNGELTGYILEQSAMKYFTRKAFSFKAEEEKKIVKRFINVAHKVGVTSVGDMEIIDILKQNTYKKLEEEGELDLRIFFSPSIKKTTNQLDELKKNYKSEKLSFLGAKGFLDGTPLGHTGLMINEYTDMPGYCGESAVDLIWLEDKISELYKNDIPVRLHACGDSAVRKALQFIKGAQEKYGKKDIRSSVEHIEVISEEDLSLFKETNTIASIQPTHMNMLSFDDHPIFEIIGEDRSKMAWLGKSLEKNGAIVSMGTDCPIVELEPFKTIHYAVNREMEDGTPEGGWNKEEKFTLAEAIKCSTINGAILFNAESMIGTLEEGKEADIIILDRNIFETNKKCLKEVKVEKTIVAGKVFDIL